jgi:DNA recombination protein RmuC
MTFLSLLAGLAAGAGATALLLFGRVADLRARLAAERARADDRERLAHEFGALSARALQANNETFLALARAEFGTLREAAGGDLERRQHALGELVAPLRDSLGRVDERLERLESDRAAGRAQLGEQLRALVDSNERLRGETGALASALRSPQARGRWGELGLRRVVEMAGMTAHCDFVEQRSVDGDERVLRPDLVVRLPGGRQVVVDAKAPLSAFLNAHEASSEEDRRRHLAAHARALRDHIRRLSAKAYWSQFQSAPDFVVLFLPGEHFHHAALESAPDLIEEGVRQHVLLATPTTLIALLRAVAFGWQQERVADSARAIADAGRELHGRLGALLGRLDTLGRRLNGTVGAYNDAVASLEARVMPSARRLAEHGVAGDADALAAPRQVGTVPRALAAPAAPQGVAGEAA